MEMSNYIPLGGGANNIKIILNSNQKSAKNELNNLSGYFFIFLKF
jgi:hypothetical protein